MFEKISLNNLQFKVLLVFLIVALVPLGIVATFSIKTAEELIFNMASNQLVNVANDKVSLLERWMSERKSDLKVVAGSSILKSMDPEQIAAYLKLVGNHYQVYRGFVVLSHEGDVVYDSFGMQHNYVLEECYKQPLTERLIISDILFDPELNKSFFQVSAPIFDDEGEIKGIVCAAVDTHTILSMVLRVSLGETGETYLVDKNGTFLAHKEPRRILTENISQSDSFRNIFGGGQRRKIYTDYRGIEVLGASRRITDTNWYLVVEQDRDEAFLSADRLEKYIYLVIVFFLLVAILLAFLLSYYVVHPIQRLSEATQTIARGEFEKAQVKTKRKDEIGVLYHAFDFLARQLQARQKSLKEKMDLTRAELEETDVKLKKTQLAATRSEQLAALGRLAAGVTHEIRTPLTSIKLFLQSAQNEIEISPEFVEDFQVAMNQVKRIESTINRFLDFARPQDPVFSVIDIKQLIEGALLVVKPRANQQETTVEIWIDDGLPNIRGDKKQLSEALLNLMVNALEAMPDRGRLTIRASLDRCELDSGFSKCIRIDISDTGPGITDEDIPRLFEPFFTTKAAGTGLGLSIVYTTIQTHGGDIKVKKGPHGGITFSVFLPRIVKKVLEGYGKDIDRG
ncbi:MAG: ATP-binding protein [bacterium]